MTIYKLDILLSQFWTNSFFHVWFSSLFLLLHLDFSGDRYGVWYAYLLKNFPKFVMVQIIRGFQFSSVTQSCPTLCDPMDCSTPGLPVPHHLLELAQTHVHRVIDAIQPSHSLSSPSPSAVNLSQHQGLLQWVGFSHQVVKVLEFPLQHQSFQWIFRTDLL